MANPSSYQETISWIRDLTEEIKCIKYPGNRKGISDGLNEQRSTANIIRNNEDKVQLLISRTRDAVQKDELQTAFKSLKALSDKKLHCLQTMQSVSSLEDNCGRLSREMDEQAVGMVRVITRELESRQKGMKNSQSLAEQNIMGFIGTSAQDCIFGLRDNWDWIKTLVRCTDIHLKNAAEYHQFYHEVEETEEWLVEDLNRVAERFDKQEWTASPQDSQLLQKYLDETYISLRQWEARTNRLFDSATKLIPVPRRTEGSIEIAPARTLADYHTSQISIRDGEDILLLDNRNPKMWKIRNGKGEEGDVPALTVLIPGPDKQAIDAAVNMRLRLLASWTNALKKIGKQLICFMLHVFKPEYKPEQIKAIASIDHLNKDKMLDILTLVEEGLKKHWSDHEGFINLQERILALRMALEEFNDSGGSDETLTEGLILQVTALGEIIKIYQDMFKDWEHYKVSVEASRAPELMLIVDKWEQLQFVTREFFSKFWKATLPMNESEKSLMSQNKFLLDGVQYEDSVQYEDITDGVSPRSQKTASVFALESVTPDESGQMYTARIQTSTPIRAQQPVYNQSADDSGFSETRTVFKGRDGRLVEERTSSMNASGPQTARVNPVTIQGEDARTRMSSSTTEFSIVRRHGQIDPNSGSSSTGVVVWSDNSKNEEGTIDEGMFETVIRTDGRKPSSNSDGWSDEGMYETKIRTEQISNRYGDSRKSGDSGWSDEGSSGSGSFDTITRTETQEKQKRAVKPIVLQLNSIDSNQDEEGFEEIKEINVKGVKVEEHEGTNFGIATERKIAETEQLCSAEMEERKTFVIRSVINPVDKTNISLKDAIDQGIICPQGGTYVNTVTRETTPIACAMSDGLIDVVYTTVRRSPEKRSTIGIITVKTIREMVRPYTIKSVKDTSRGQMIDQEEATKKGILDTGRGMYNDRRSGKRMLITEAAEKGLIEIEYLGDSPREPEIISKVYAVRAVVDRRLKRTVTFNEAIRAGIIDKESGAYWDNLTGEKMYVGDAIMRGFLKARLLQSSFGLNIDPENRMVIDKTDRIRKQLLQPLSVISAFKKAVKDGASKK